MVTNLQHMIERARDRVAAMSPAELAEMLDAQRRSFVRAEAGFGSDADEAAYSRAIIQGDRNEIAGLEAEASARVDAVNVCIAQKGPEA